MTNDEARLLVYENALTYVSNRANPYAINSVILGWDMSVTVTDEQKELMAETFTEIAEFIRGKMADLKS